MSVFARFIHGFFLWFVFQTNHSLNLYLRLRPPVIISVETKCYTKKLFTKKRSGQNKRENVEDMFLLQNNPNMCAESFGRILGKLNKQSDMGELTYDWEIEMNGDFVEYTQVRLLCYQKIHILFRLKQRLRMVMQEQSSLPSTMTWPILTTLASSKKRTTMQSTRLFDG